MTHPRLGGRLTRALARGSARQFAVSIVIIKLPRLGSWIRGRRPFRVGQREKPAPPEDGREEIPAPQAGERRERGVALVGSPDGPVPLSSLPAGACGQVVRIEGEDGLDRRLFAFGLTPGTPVRVIAASGGAVVIRVRGVRLALDARAASRTRIQAVGTSPTGPAAPPQDGRNGRGGRTPA